MGFKSSSSCRWAIQCITWVLVGQFPLPVFVEELPECYFIYRCFLWIAPFLPAIRWLVWLDKFSHSPTRHFAGCQSNMGTMYAVPINLEVCASVWLTLQYNTILQAMKVGHLQASFNVRTYILSWFIRLTVTQVEVHQEHYMTTLYKTVH